MYSTCLFCHAKLGSNESIEHFPVGKRLAFDESNGRLWVICRKCERWNLTPIEERWEAIEECERAFRSATMRMSTDNIGLARVAGGLDLVRIGRPERPEFAAWRYGDQFGKRRRRNIATAGVAAGVLGLAALGPVFGASGILTLSALFVARGMNARDGSTKIPIAGAAYPFVVERKHLVGIRLLPDDSAGWMLDVPIRTPLVDPFNKARGERPPTGIRFQRKRFGSHAIFSGSEGLRAAGQVLSVLYRRGAARNSVESAVGYLGGANDPNAFLAREARRLDKRFGVDPVSTFPNHVRLAMEMAVNESVERRALQGELAQLELAWRQAEEIASISDNLLVPEEVADWVEARQGDNSDGPKSLM